MAAFSGTAYMGDSDADDEFERSVISSPTQMHEDLSDDDTSSEIHSNEHTPTTFGTPFDDGIRPRNVISEWTAEESAHFVASLGLRQYSEQFIQDEIVGEALIALGHDELKELGISSAGHRLKILKEVYNVKVRQDIPIESDHYTPPSIAAMSEQERATKEDVVKLTNAILRLRDERIVQLEQQLTKLADDNRKLRIELWPVFKMVKEKEPLPHRPSEGTTLASPEYPPEQLMSPPLPMAEAEKPKSSLSRTFSKRLGLGSGVPKNNSPTHIVGAIPENRATHDGNMSGLQPSAAASAASNSLTAGMSGGTALPHYSPNPNSPTSPMPTVQPLNSRTFQRDPSAGYRYDGSEDAYRNAIPTPPLTGVAQDPIAYRSATTIGSKHTFSNASTLVPNREMSASVPPTSAGNSRSNKDSSKESDAADQIFKSFRVALDDPCWKVLPAALRKYNIQADWRQYALYIVYGGDQERCVNLEEKPLALFKDLDREGKKPMFMLRKLANGIVADMPAAAQPPPRPGTTGPGPQNSSGASVRAMGQDSRMLPGGII